MQKNIIKKLNEEKKGAIDLYTSLGCCFVDRDPQRRSSAAAIVCFAARLLSGFFFAAIARFCRRATTAATATQAVLCQCQRSSFKERTVLVLYLYMIVCTCRMYLRILVWYCSSSIRRDPAGIYLHLIYRSGAQYVIQIMSVWLRKIVLALHNCTHCRSSW